ncbi:hypothetical protein DVH24_007484 [Malus domestica]|uniref:Origin of replication complex subunit 4 n=1 Tax=Malus domestica TaxID=3750 RepID=A0A498HFH6_MALDO|nr:hypothetical protein DVH24_007484 [Malus domestica]
MARENPTESALCLLRTRLCDPNFAFKALSHSDDSNYSKLKFLVSSSITEACNNSILLLGPRGSGKIAVCPPKFSIVVPLIIVLELVLSDLLQEFPDMISVIRLSGLLHSSDNCAFKEIARQLCVEHQLVFSRMASFDDNSQFMIAMLRECGLAHKTIIFVLDEFDLFALGKQRLLYSLLDAMQSVTSQAVVIGVSSRLRGRLLEHILLLPTDSSFPPDYVIAFNAKLQRSHLVRWQVPSPMSGRSRLLIVDHGTRFRAVSDMDLESGMLSLENFKTALSNIQRHPKLECIKDCSVLELYILVCMKRLEVKEQNSYNFNAVMKEYKSIHDSVKTADYFARNVCLRAFEHLLQRELIGFADNRGQNQSIEFSPVKLLISSHELHQGMKSYGNSSTINGSSKVELLKGAASCVS